MQTETKKPLYKVLNEKRTQGEWYIVENYKTLIFQKRPPNYEPSSYPIVECRPTTFEEQEANAQYTALAVNNLHHLAEAMEKTKELILLIEREWTLTPEQKEYINEMFHLVREPLLRIS